MCTGAPPHEEIIPVFKGALSGSDAAALCGKAFRHNLYFSLVVYSHVRGSGLTGQRMKPLTMTFARTSLRSEHLFAIAKLKPRKKAL